MLCAPKLLLVTSTDVSIYSLAERATIFHKSWGHRRNLVAIRIIHGNRAIIYHQDSYIIVGDTFEEIFGRLHYGDNRIIVRGANYYIYESNSGVSYIVIGDKTYWIPSSITPTWNGFCMLVDKYYRCEVVGHEIHCYPTNWKRGARIIAYDSDPIVMTADGTYYQGQKYNTSCPRYDFAELLPTTPEERLFAVNYMTQFLPRVIAGLVIDYIVIPIADCHAINDIPWSFIPRAHDPTGLATIVYH